ncbi:ABC transporter substrate-binding protein [Candidatus Woesearchaeota archaeon]|nr:ABC transporter substrate-binding protein [Candidatus Woesearchaeota archaeon]
MNTKIVILVVLVCIIALSGCQEKQTIKIGVVGTMTGVGSYLGQQELRGLEIAKEEINTRGGINGKMVEFVVEDSEAQPAKAVTAVNKLINLDGVRFIIGDSWSETTGTMVPVTNEAGVLLISPVCILDTVSQDDLFFRTVPTINDMMDVLAEYAYNEMGSRRVGVLRSETSFGKEHVKHFRESFEELGGEIVAEEGFVLTQKDVHSEIIKVNEEQPDTIFNLHASGPTLGLLMKQAKELDVDVKWLASFGAENAQLLKDYSEVAEGLTYPYVYDTDSKEQSISGFIQKYKDRYNELPDFSAATSYDAMMVLATAIEKVGENPYDAKQYLLNAKGFKGGSGVFSFDKNGDVEKPIFIKQVKDGLFIKV